jgi:chromate reductase, NAD(P)H dehydrogenase (quinone)
MRVLALSGSLRRDSHNRALLRAAQELAPVGVEVEVYDGWADVPAFNEDLEHDPPASVEDFREQIAEADAVLIATPEYNGSIPGALKNALDWASRPHGLSALAGKPVAVVSSSPSPFGATWAGEHLRRALALSGAVVVEQELAIGKVDQKLSGGGLTDSETRAELRDLLAELAQTASAELALAA